MLRIGCSRCGHQLVTFGTCLRFACITAPLLNTDSPRSCLQVPYKPQQRGGIQVPWWAGSQSCLQYTVRCAMLDVPAITGNTSLRNARNVSFPGLGHWRCLQRSAPPARSRAVGLSGVLGKMSQSELSLLAAGSRLPGGGEAVQRPADCICMLAW